MQIRNAEPGDWIWIHKILRDPKVINNTGHSDSPSEDTVKERWFNRLADPLVHTLVAEADDRVVGYARLKQGTGRGSHAGEISIVAVHSEWQGRGIGTQLMKGLLEVADHSLRLKRLRITVHADNEVARKMYERLGFEIEGRERMATYKNGRYEDALIMGRLRD
jgi:putative acetyltransferase